MMKTVLILLTLLQLSLFAANTKSSDEIDYVTLATLLMKDGYYSRAVETLNEADTTQEAFDFAMYYTLQGLIYAKQKLYTVSNEAFDKAIASGQDDRSIYLYMAQNSFKLHAYQETLDALQRARALVTQKPQLLSLKAECYWKLKQHNKALQTLEDLEHTFKTYYALYKQRFNYLIELELYQSAFDDAQVYLLKEKANVKSYLSFVGALRKSGAMRKATLLAERGNLLFDDSAEMTVMLAHLYLDQEMINSAANLFDEASIEDSKYTKEAAEMLRRAHEFTLSLYKNAQLTDTKEKYKQRIAIYLEFSAYERVVATAGALKRSGLIEDENIRYALAYAYYMNGDFEKSEQELAMLRRSDLFEKATVLRKNIQKCQNDMWECAL